MKKAIIYCRVSSDRQVKDGHGLESQESRCRKHAENKNYEVVSVFQDEAVSGGLFERKAMRELIIFLKKMRNEQYIVIFDDLKRFARDVNVHLQLKAELLSYGATLECLNFNFEDSPEGRFIELIIAGQGQLEREQNGRQVKQKMKARMEAGYWCMNAPSGYHFQKDKIHGRILSPIAEDAPLLKQALEGFAHGRFSCQKQVMLFLNKHQFHGRPVYKLLSFTRLFLFPLFLFRV